MSANGGGPAEIGIFLYQTCIRSIMEAVYPVWCTVSVTEFKKLEEIQRSALRTATGTRHGVALSVLEVLTGTPPLKQRLEQSLINEFSKILAKSSSDPLKSLILKLKDDKLHMDKKILSPLHIVKSVLREIGTTIEELETNIEKSVPRVYSTNKVCPKVVKIDDGKWSRSGERTIQQVILAKVTITNYVSNLAETTLIAFTDGSALGNPGPCGSAAIIYKDGYENEPMRLHRPISVKSTSYHGEMDGLCLCISNAHEILSKENSKSIEKIHIFCDCRGAIESVTSNDRILSHQSIKDEFIKHLTELNMKQILTEISWVSGHADLEANELADNDAKKAANEAKNLNLPPVLTNNAIKSICKQRTLKRWQKSWNIYPTGRMYNELHSKVKVMTYRSHLPAYKERLLLRAQTMTTNLKGENSWMAQLQEDFSPLCACGDKETLRHVLMDCTLLNEERNVLESEIMNVHRMNATPIHLRTFDYYTLLGGENEVKNQTRLKIEECIANFLVSAKNQI